MGVLTGFSGDAGAFQIFAMTLRDHVRTTRRERIEETFSHLFLVVVLMNQESQSNR